MVTDTGTARGQVTAIADVVAGDLVAAAALSTDPRFARPVVAQQATGAVGAALALGDDA